MKKLPFILLFLTVSSFFTACTPSAKDAFETLKQLEGNWKSKGNIIVYESWSLESDSLITGYQFTKRGENQLVLERYYIERNNDSVLFVILHPEKAVGGYKFPLVKARFGVFTFENPTATYPNRILIDFENDSTFSIRKENIRGKKSIEFEMKKRKE